MRPRPWRGALKILGALLLGLAVAASARTQTPEGAAAPLAPSASAAEHRLGAGDVVRITVFQNPDLSLEPRLSDIGAISYPLLGNVSLAGLTVAEAERRIADGLRNGNYVRQPQVSMLVLQVRSSQVSVLGHVNRPGRYPIEAGALRLTDLLALTGGIASTGGDLVVVIGRRDGRPLRLEIDLPGSFAAGGTSLDVTLQHDDTVWVERAPVVYIYGEVQKPGALRLQREMTLMQALAAGGGLTPRGTEKGIRVHRRGADGRLQVLMPAMDERVRDGDVVQVRESLF
jgi:polysaccharide export outer membrane protein